MLLATFAARFILDCISSARQVAPASLKTWVEMWICCKTLQFQDKMDESECEEARLSQKIASVREGFEKMKKM